MKQSNLLDHIQLPDITLSLFDESTILTSKKSCLLLYPDKSSFLKQVLPQLVKHKSITLVISCMDNDIIKKCFDHVITTKTFPETIKILEDLFNCDTLSKYVLKFLDVEIQFIVVHNISAFYYDLEVLDKYNYKKLGFVTYNPNIPHEYYYNSLGYLLNKICAKYKCSGIVTSYDLEFNCGVVGTYSYKPQDDLQIFTKLPVSFIKLFDMAIHLNRSKEIDIIKQT